MRAEQQLRTFLKVFESYPADRPIAKFLPDFFKNNRQMGATDRRNASRMIYNYFRIGKSLSNKTIQERLFLAEFLCSTIDNPFLNHFRPDLNQRISLTIDEKVAYAQRNEGFVLTEVFPFYKHFSEGINQDQFLKSMFIQPDLFIRLSKNSVSKVLNILETNNIDFKLINDYTVSLPNGTNLNRLFPENDFQVMPYQVQDLSSQYTLTYFKPKPNDYWWDACAASGGKSLLLFSEESNIQLVVSDIRESILDNLNRRFQAVGIRNYQKKLIDLSKNPDPELHHYAFDGIILDAPCTGSGTWGRTPEMISQFEDFKIKQFQNLQKTIASNTIKYLKEGKPLIYITCSVFREENEDVINYLQDEHKMKLEGLELIKGYDKKADSMFVARLIR